MDDYHAPLLPGCMYHILSRAIGKEKLFRNESNYLFFLEKYKKYACPISDPYAFCLLPNHFHFLIEIKPFEQIEAYLKTKKKRKAIPLDEISDMIMECFANLLNSYAKSFNTVYLRKGGLFIDYLRRVEVTTDSQFGSTIFYIHKNPVHHGYCDDLASWRWSSFNKLLAQSETILKRAEVLDWFGGVSAFKQFHEQPIHLKNAMIVE